MNSLRFTLNLFFLYYLTMFRCIFDYGLIFIHIFDICTSIQLFFHAEYIRSNLLLNYVIMRRNLKKHPIITDTSYI